MPNYSRNDVLLVRYPFTDLSAAKLRPAVVVNAAHLSQDSFVVPLTSRLLSCVRDDKIAQANTHTMQLPFPQIRQDHHALPTRP